MAFVKDKMKKKEEVRLEDMKEQIDKRFEIQCNQRHLTGNDNG